MENNPDVNCREVVVEVNGNCFPITDVKTEPEGQENYKVKTLNFVSPICIGTEIISPENKVIKLLSGQTLSILYCKACGTLGISPNDIYCRYCGQQLKKKKKMSEKEVFKTVC